MASSPDFTIAWVGQGTGEEIMDIRPIVVWSTPYKKSNKQNDTITCLY
jgi:hypothetical protein